MIILHFKYMLPVFRVVVRHLAEVNNSAESIGLETGVRPDFLCISILREGFLTTNICMINLWTLALPAWLNTLHFAKNSMSTSTVSIHIHLGKLQLLELCHGSEDKKSFDSCHLDIFLHYLFYRWWMKSVANIQGGISYITLYTLIVPQVKREVKKKKNRRQKDRKNSCF